MKRQNLTRRIYSDKDIQKVESQLLLLGDNAKYDAVTYMNIRILTSILVFCLILYTMKSGYLFAPFLTIAYYYLFGYLTLTRPIKARTRKLDREALYFFEILTLTLESGRNLENALEITVFNVDSEISSEFKRTLFEIKFGKSLMEALEHMKKRIPSETINNIILNITQTSVFGNSIIDTMYHQIDFLRDKQLLAIKGEMAKIPNKISIISVLFIVPLILLLILSPFVIEILA